MKQESRVYEESLTNERLFASPKSRFDIVNEAIEKARAVVVAGKDAISPAFETLKAMSEGKELALPDRPKRVPLEIHDEERGPRTKKASLIPVE